jgi:hypothetical protein
VEHRDLAVSAIWIGLHIFGKRLGGFLVLAGRVESERIERVGKFALGITQIVALTNTLRNADDVLVEARREKRL